MTATGRLTLQEVILLLDLKPLPREGGYFRETYRAIGGVSPNDESKNAIKPASTAIFYAISPDSFSALHRLPQDEVYHFYLGDAVELVTIGKDGELASTVLGPHLKRGHALQSVVPGRFWQGAKLAAGGEFALLGCTVAPGFDFSDYEHGDRAALIARFPQHARTIERYTREETDT